MQRYLAVAFALAASASALAAQQLERFTLRGPEVAIYNLVGELKVVGATSGADVVAEVVRAGADAGRLEMETGELRGRQALRIVYPGDRIVHPGRDSYWGRTELRVRADGTFGDGSSDDGRRVTIASRGDGLDARANVTVSVPRGKRIALHLAVGTVNVSNVEGDIVVDVHAASITTERTKGRLSLDTGSGEVTVTDHTDGDLELDTGSGGVRLTRVTGPLVTIDAGSGGVSATDLTVDELRMDLGSGRTRLSRIRAKDLSLDAGSGGVDVEFLQDVRTVEIDAGSGGVTLRLPESLGAAVDIETGSGGIDFDIPLTITRQSRDRIVGTIGDGQGRIRIDTGSGGVRLLRS